MNAIWCKAAALAGACVFAIASSCQSVDRDARIDGSNLDATITRVMERDDIQSVCAAIFDERGIAWANAHGLADPEREIEASTETTYLLSSISKLFVATAVMQEVERGRLDLDVDVSQYLGFAIRNPDHPDIPITLRMLLGHRAGLVNPTPPDSLEFYRFIEGASPPELGPILEGWFASGQTLWLDGTPGLRAQNSNLGVVLCALAVERVSGERFSDYCARRIFAPLGMTQTSYDQGELEYDRIAAVRTPRGQWLRAVSGPPYPMGLARSTAEDLSRFCRAMMAGGELDGARILRAHTVREMLTVDQPDANMAFGSGLAKLWRASGPEQKWIGHTGGGIITACMDFHVDDEVGVVILTNGRGKRAVTPGGEIYQALHEAARGAR